MWSRSSSRCSSVSSRLLHTFRYLAVRPGRTIRKYLQGERKPYYNPVDYDLLMGGLVILLSQLVDEDLFSTMGRENEADAVCTL
jgi:hypothetical protein